MIKNRASWVCNRCHTRGCKLCGQESFERRLEKENELLLWNDDVVARARRSQGSWTVGVMVFFLIFWLVVGLYLEMR